MLCMNRGIITLTSSSSSSDIPSLIHYTQPSHPSHVHYPHHLPKNRPKNSNATSLPNTKSQNETPPCQKIRGIKKKTPKTPSPKQPIKKKCKAPNKKQQKPPSNHQSLILFLLPNFGTPFSPSSCGGGGGGGGGAYSGAVLAFSFAARMISSYLTGACCCCCWPNCDAGR